MRIGSMRDRGAVLLLVRLLVDSSDAKLTMALAKEEVQRLDAQYRLRETSQA